MQMMICSRPKGCGSQQQSVGSRPCHLPAVINDRQGTGTEEDILCGGSTNETQLDVTTAIAAAR